jgi:Calcineurin-like phosphoesterase
MEKVVTTYDVIGDIHGCATKLHGLLALLGWRSDGSGTYKHPEPNHKAIFVGDLIDRGGEQLETLQTVRRMVESGCALLVMGNHEFNAISYALKLRPHSEKNRRQHNAFLEQLNTFQQAEWLTWFRTLPLWLELGALRVVHACWHQQSIKQLDEAFGSSVFPAGDALFERANDPKKEDPVWEAVEVLLKGPEISLDTYELPCYLDKEGQKRDRARARWWFPNASRIGELIDLNDGITDEHGRPYPAIPDISCEEHDRSFSYSDSIPVIYGHHWRTWEPSENLDWTPRTACVDFSAVRGGHMVAYTWRGENQLSPTHYVQFPPT